MQKIFSIISIFILLLLASSLVNADTSQKGTCVKSSITSVDPSSVSVDQEFTVGIVIENCGEIIPDNVSFQIVHPSEDISIKEPIVLEIGKLEYSNSKRFILYHMRTLPSASPGIYVIQTRLVYGSGSSSVISDNNFSITVTSDEAKLTLASAKTNPIFPIVDQPFTLTIRVENYGKGDANSVKANLVGLNTATGSTKSFLGQLASKDDGIIAFNLIPQEAGTFPYELVVNFKDDFGNHEYRENLELVVQKKPLNWFMISFVLVILITIFTSVWYNYRKRKREAKMIEKLSKRGG